MGKIVKFCSSCDEGFAEKFGFCPNCGQSLQTFEMNPVVKDVSPVTKAEVVAPEVVVPEIVAPAVAETVEPAMTQAAEVEDEPVMAKQDFVTVVEPVIEEPVVEAASVKSTSPAINAFVETTPVDIDRKPVSLEAEHFAHMSKGDFYVTVIEEKNVKQRNLLFLGSTVLIVSVAVGLTIWSLFKKPLTVYAIGDNTSLASLIDEVPMIVEEEQQKKDKDAGGGGGGGREEKEETTQGDLADQSKTPTRPPDAKVFRSDNFDLKMPPPQTEGNQKYEKKFDRWGDPNGRFASFSNGTGSGGGQGSGVGTGQGSGRGTGNGSGNGSGSGSGLGNGNGGGTGDGTGGSPPPPPARPVGVTQGIKIISKPRPGYTDAARQNNVQGTVILRVTFLASGQIGSISAVKGLPNGLTEQAIAAARRISFEPAKRDGVGQSITRQVEYTFSIY